MKNEMRPWDIEHYMLEPGLALIFQDTSAHIKKIGSRSQNSITFTFSSFKAKDIISQTYLLPRRNGAGCIVNLDSPPSSFVPLTSSLQRKKT
jgi:hypothetical protein